MAEWIHRIEKGVDTMRHERHLANIKSDQYSKAVAYHDNVLPLMESIRQCVDSLEEVVDDSLWPLPKYRELLFHR